MNDADANDHPMLWGHTMPGELDVYPRAVVQAAWGARSVAAAPAPADALEDLRTHRAAWLAALAQARDASPPKAADSDEAGYWQHEIHVFNRTFDALAGVHAVRLDPTPEQAARLTVAAQADAGQAVALEPGQAARGADQALAALRKQYGASPICCGCPVPGHPGDGFMQPPDGPECCQQPDGDVNMLCDIITRALAAPAAARLGPAAVMATGTEAAVCDDIARRQALGVAKYGTTVADNPLPLGAWLQHAYEEALDQAIYLKRAISEMDAQAETPAARCPNCDDAGDVHAADGEWRGICHCPAGQALRATPPRDPEAASAAPTRAFRLTLRLDADDRRSLIDALDNLADRIEREQITNGVWGSPSDGAIYELLHDPAMTHDAYHAALREYLADKVPPCAECGAMTEAEAGKKCKGGGDKDDCHGNHLWPDLR